MGTGGSRLGLSDMSLGGFSLLDPDVRGTPGGSRISVESVDGVECILQ